MVEIITQDTVWSSSEATNAADFRFRVENGATLTIAPGTKIQNRRIEIVDGAFRAEGEDEGRIALEDVTLIGLDVVLDQVDMLRGTLDIGGATLRIDESTFHHVGSEVVVSGQAEVTDSVFVHSGPIIVRGGNDVTITDNWFIFQEGIHFSFFELPDSMTIADNSFATGPRVFAYRDISLAGSYVGDIEVTGTHLRGVALADYSDRFLDHSQYSKLAWEIVDPAPVTSEASRPPPITIHDEGDLVRVGPDNTSIFGPRLESNSGVYKTAVTDGVVQVEEGDWVYLAPQVPQALWSYGGIDDAPTSRNYDVQISSAPNFEDSSADAADISNVGSVGFLAVLDDKVEPTETVVFNVELDGEYFDDVPQSYQLEIQILDKPVATETSDELVGNALENVLRGLGGNDTIVGGPGDDTIDGGAGVDTARYSGPQTAYTLTLSPTGTKISDRRPGVDGTDELKDIELLDFETNILDEPFDLRKFGGPAGLDPAQLESFIELYIAYFNRAPDAIGLNFWGTAFATGTSLEEMAALFIDQDETRATYPSSLSNADFATAVYNNVLGRVPDPDGFKFWVGVLDSGAVGRDEFILEVLRGAKADPPPGASQDFIDQQLADRAYLESKIDIGAYFAVHKGLSDVSNASAAMTLFDGTPDSTTGAVGAINTYYADALDPTTGEFLMPLVGVLDDPFQV